MATDGLKTIQSSYGPEETMKRLEAEIRAKGMTVFAHIDHAAGAASVGLSLRPTDLLIFGNARGGTPLMQAEQTAGIDLPLKALVWQDASGTTWPSYNDPAMIRFGSRTGTAWVMLSHRPSMPSLLCSRRRQPRPRARRSSAERRDNPRCAAFDELGRGADHAAPLP